jgi:hypothetical protein
MEEISARKFGYDPWKLTYPLTHYEGTITPNIVTNPAVWFNILLYFVWIYLDRHVKLHMIASATLIIPGSLFAFFITGQVRTGLAKFDKMRRTCRDSSKSAYSMLTQIIGAAEGNLETIAVAEKITTCMCAAQLLTFVSMSQHLAVVYPTHFLEQKLLTQDEIEFYDQLEPDHHSHPGDKIPHPRASVTLKIQEALQLVRVLEKGENAIPVAITLRGILQKFQDLLENLLESSKLNPPPSVHLFSCLFLLLFLPMCSLAFAQDVIEIVTTDAEFVAATTGGFICLVLLNFAFHGMFSLNAIMHDPFGADAEDINTLSMSRDCVQTCRCLIACSQAQSTTVAPLADDNATGVNRFVAAIADDNANATGVNRFLAALADDNAMAGAPPVSPDSLHRALSRPL